MWAQLLPVPSGPLSAAAVAVAIVLSSRAERTVFQGAPGQPPQGCMLKAPAKGPHCGCYAYGASRQGVLGLLIWRAVVLPCVRPYILLGPYKPLLREVTPSSPARKGVPLGRTSLPALFSWHGQGCCQTI